MSTKKCSKCGWEYPIDWPGRTCRFCREPFIDGICSRCGKYSEKLHRGRCQACYTEMHRDWRDKHRSNADAAYKEWMKKIESQPYPYQALTEEQWMEACRHFGGCAYCGDAEIDARSMFISFKEGGRYCAWNVIPACEKCETALKIDPNPFLRMDDRYHRGSAHSARKCGFTLENLQRIVDYLERKMQ